MDGINIVQVILILVVLVNGLFAIRFVLDVLQHKEELKEEPGNPVAMAIVSFFMFFLSTFGISDFAIGSSLYPKAKEVAGNFKSRMCDSGCGDGTGLYIQY